MLKKCGDSQVLHDICICPTIHFISNVLQLMGSYCLEVVNGLVIILLDLNFLPVEIF